MRLIVFLTIWFSPLLLMAQLPQSDLILFDIKKEDQTFQVSNPRFINNFNKGSYNNQPSFFDAQKIYFSASTSPDAHTDIYAIDLLRKQLWQVTDTPDGEYSPTLMPTKRYFSAVIQEDKTNTQSLWQFPIDQSSLGENIFPEIEGIGYHCWLNRNEAALFIVENPAKLIVADRYTQEHKTIIDQIGRCLKPNSVGRLYFVHKSNPESWYIKRYDSSNNTITNIVQTPDKAEDFELMSDETIIMSKGSKLLSFNPDSSKKWQEIADLSMYGIKKVSRIDIFGEKLVVVSIK